MERNKKILVAILGFIMAVLSFVVLMHSLGTELWREVSATLCFAGFLTLSILLTVQLIRPKK